MFESFTGAYNPLYIVLNTMSMKRAQYVYWGKLKVSNDLITGTSRKMCKKLGLRGNMIELKMQPARSKIKNLPQKLLGGSRRKLLICNGSDKERWEDSVVGEQTGCSQKQTKNLNKNNKPKIPLEIYKKSLKIKLLLNQSQSVWFLKIPRVINLISPHALRWIPYNHEKCRN
jgi:hypothetical protein